MLRIALRRAGVEELHSGHTKTWNDFKVPDEAISCGFHEAVRGVLSHHVVIRKGKIANYLAAGLLSAFAHSPNFAVRDFDGEVDLGSGSNPLAAARLKLRIRADSLEVTDPVSDKDRAEVQRKMREEVFETDTFPEISYECSRLTGSGVGDHYWVALRGELSLCGITREVPITAKVTRSDNSLRATGEFSLRQSDFGIALVSAAAGTIRVTDEVKCSFDIVARQT